MVAGALATTSLVLALPRLPPVILLPAALAAGLVAGGAWGAVPGLLKVRFDVNEILSTIMLNIVAVQVALELGERLLAAPGHGTGDHLVARSDGWPPWAPLCPEPVPGSKDTLRSPYLTSTFV